MFLATSIGWPDIPILPGQSRLSCMSWVPTEVIWVLQNLTVKCPVFTLGKSDHPTLVARGLLFLFMTDFLDVEWLLFSTQVYKSVLNLNPDLWVLTLNRDLRVIPKAELWSNSCDRLVVSFWQPAQKKKLPVVSVIVADVDLHADPQWHSWCYIYHPVGLNWPFLVCQWTQWTFSNRWYRNWIYVCPSTEFSLIRA